jgi:hypothetical protein
MQSRHRYFDPLLPVPALLQAFAADRAVQEHRMRIARILLLAIPFLGCAGPAGAEIYKCVGKDGQMQFGQFPSASGRCEIVGGADAPASSDSGGSESLTAYAHKLDEEHAQEDHDRAEAARQAAQKKARCSEAKRHVAYVESTGRVYRVDENGERTYLSDQEVDQRRAEARQRMEAECR